MDTLDNRALELSGQKRRRRARNACVGLLAVAIVAATAVCMQLPAFAQKKQAHCGIDGHEHTLACYSDPTADVEEEADWTRSFPRPQPKEAGEALAGIAASQLGYQESDKNYYVNDANETSGYTRYGAWDGSAYEEWNTAFVRFCLHYAGFDDALGLSDGPAAGWVKELKAQGRYEDAATLRAPPQPGDLAFFTDAEGNVLAGVVVEPAVGDKAEDGTDEVADKGTDEVTDKGTDEDEKSHAKADADAGVGAEAADKVAIVAGDSGNAVEELRFGLADAGLLGFGRLGGQALASDPESTPSEPESAPEPSEPGPGKEPSANAAQVEPEPQDGPDVAGPVAEVGAPADADEPVAEVGAPADADEPAVEVRVPQDPVPPEASPDTTAPTTLTAQVAGVQVAVQVDLPAKAGYRLAAKRVSPTSKRLRKVEDAQSEELPNGVTKRARVDKDTLLVDLSILDADGNEVEPANGASVTVTHAPAAAPDDKPTAAPTAAPADEAPTVVHFGANGTEVLDAEPQDEGFAFQTQGFSLFAFAFTVDFYYEGYEYHLPGTGELLLSDLFAKLDIKEDAGRVELLEFSDPSLLSVERQHDDWLLTSIAPFDTKETLTARMDNGDVYVVQVTDAKSYYFNFNVSDGTAGCVYAQSSNYGPQVTGAVADNGVCAITVRPRSADEPTNGHYSATRGFRFVGWRVNGYEDYGMGATGDGVATGDAYSVRPSIAEDKVAERKQTFTACFAPDDQYLITFDKYIWADENNQVNGYVTQGGAKAYTYLDEDGANQNVFFCYSGSAYGALAVPNDDSKFIGWYRSGTDDLVCESAYFVAPEGLSDNITVQARFVKAEQCTVRYRSYNAQNGGYVGKITITGRTDSAQDVTEQVYEQRAPSGATAADRSGYTFVAWRDENDRIVTRDHELKDLPAVTQDVEYRAEYLSTGTNRILFSVSTPGAGVIKRGGTDVTDQWQGLSTTSNISLSSSVTAVPNDGYRFDHWEFNGEVVGTDPTIKDLGKPASPKSNVQELVAVFVPICTISYDLSVTQQVGNNAGDYQHWQDVPWCPKDVELTGAPANIRDLGNDTYQFDVDHNGTFVLPDLARNNPAGDATIRVSQTNNGYNLLTHTFKGWRLKDGDGTIYPADTEFTALGSATYEAVWDAYLPGKAGYYSTSDVRANRYNTNTCGFFVRLFDASFDKGNTNTYTDCLFTSRVILGGDSAFATNDRVGGIRMDFFGNSDAADRDQIDAIDAELRSHANTEVPYSEQYSGQSNGTAYPGSTITFEQPFPSDEFIFARIRAWNASIGESRKIQINGEKIPQSMLTTDYFDLRWYVLKDQENSWHVDGMLIPKYAKLVVRKRFEGDAQAIARNTDPARNFFIGVTETAGRTENSYKASVEGSEYYKLEEIQLTLDPADADGTVHTQTRNNPRTGATDEVTVRKYCYTYKDEDTGEYVWELNTLEPLTRYYLAEHNYVDSGEGFSTTKSWFILNTQEDTTAGDSYRVDKGVTVYSYPEGTTSAEVQLVSFSNRYTRPHELRITKLDATTKGPLDEVPFTFALKSADGAQTILTLARSTDQNGEISLLLSDPFEYDGNEVSLPDGTYRFELTEQGHQGYKALSEPITGTIALASNKPVDVELDPGSQSDLVYVRDTDKDSEGRRYRPTLYIENEPSTKRVEVAKRWTNGATTPVTMQLLRNGVPVLGMSVELGESNDWRHAWDGLPAYVDGAEATYTVREEWIGEPGGEDSVHYNANADADGYEDYLVNQTQSVTTLEDGTDVVSVYVENTPSTGQVVFGKVDDSKRAVAGAEFTVYVDKDCTTEADAGDFVNAPGTPRPAVFTSDKNGMVSIEGLRVGTYYLKETRVPSGYAMAQARTYTLAVGSKNSSMTYEDENAGPTLVTQVVNPVYSRKVSLLKVITGTTTPVQGAVFSLHGSLANGSMDPLAMRGYAGLTSDDKGGVELGSLRQGTYYLVEESAPPGFNLLESPVRITVPGDDDTAVTAIKIASNTALSVSGDVITVSNSRGVELPQTGGMGTGVLPACGVVLVLWACVKGWEAIRAMS